MKMSKNKTMIIAEVGSVHDGSFGNAMNLIKEAKKCGADAVKFQTHLAEFESTKNAPNPKHFTTEKRYDYFQRTAFKLDQYKKLIKEAKKNKILFLSSPFSIESVDFLERLNLSLYKIPSGEVTNIPLLERVKKTNKKILLSTGMSTIKEISNAIKIFDKKKVTLMQCTSIYPCPLNKVGINLIKKFKNKYNCSVGFSDHSEGAESAIYAVIMGANIVEKHITFSKKMYGSDAKYAMELNEFKKFCKSIRDTEILINNKVNKDRISRELKSTRKVFTKSIAINKNLKKNYKIKFSDLSFLKPGNGISAKNYKKVIGKKLKRDIPKNTIIKSKDFI